MISEILLTKFFLPTTDIHKTGQNLSRLCTCMNAISTSKLELQYHTGTHEGIF